MHIFDTNGIMCFEFGVLSPNTTPTEHKMHLRPTHTPIPRLLRDILTTAVALAPCFAATAQTHQFRAAEFTNANGGASWPCANDPSVALSNTHPGTNGWTQAAKSQGIVRFGEPGSLAASPLELDAAYTGVVKQAYIVLVCDASTPLATILSAPAPARFVVGEDSWFETPDTAAARALSESLLGINSEISVNAKPTNLLKPKSAPQLVRVVFEDGDTPLSRVFFGGAAGSARWERAFAGGFLEILTFSGDLDENQTACLLKYLSVKYKLGFPSHAVSDPAQTLRKLGVKHDGVFATLAIVR